MLLFSPPFSSSSLLIQSNYHSYTQIWLQIKLMWTKLICLTYTYSQFFWHCVCVHTCMFFILFFIYFWFYVHTSVPQNYFLTQGDFLMNLFSWQSELKTWRWCKGKLIHWYWLSSCLWNQKKSLFSRESCFKVGKITLA